MAAATSVAMRATPVAGSRGMAGANRIPVPIGVGVRPEDAQPPTGSHAIVNIPPSVLPGAPFTISIGNSAHTVIAPPGSAPGMPVLMWIPAAAPRLTAAPPAFPTNPFEYSFTQNEPSPQVTAPPMAPQPAPMLAQMHASEVLDSGAAHGRPVRRRTASPAATRAAAANVANVALAPAAVQQGAARLKPGAPSPSLHSVTLHFQDEGLENDWRLKAFAEQVYQAVLCWLLVAVGMASTHRELPGNIGASNLHTSLAAASTVILLSGCVLRWELHQLPPKPSVLLMWKWCSYLLAFGMLFSLYMGGSHAYDMKWPLVDDVHAYGMMCIGHVAFHCISSFSVSTDASFTFFDKSAINLMVIVGTVLSGNPSPYLSTRISLIASGSGALFGTLAARYVERTSREGYLRETVLNDTILVWRAVAGGGPGTAGE